MSLEPWKAQRIGNLRERVKLQDFTTTTGPFNEEIEAWTTVAEVWARIEPLKGDEVVAAGQVSAFKSATIHVRYRGDLDPTWRIVHGSTTEVDGEDVPDEGSTIYNIIALRNTDERKRYLAIDAKAAA